MKKVICLLGCCLVVVLLCLSCSKIKSESDNNQTTVTIDGLTWATCNVGAISRGDVGTLFTYEGALKACPDNWRLPTRIEIETMMTLFLIFGEDFDCHRHGLYLSGSSPEGDSVFLPCAGYNFGNGRRGIGEIGCYWLSAGDYFVFKGKYGTSYYDPSSPFGGMYSGKYDFAMPPDGICAFSVRCVKQ